VGFPKVDQPEFLACLTQEALDRFAHRLRPGGVLLADSHHVRRLRQLDARIYSLPMWLTVKDRIGLPVAFNVCALGGLVGLTGVVRPESLRAVLAGRVPARLLDRNIDAFDAGLALAAEARPWRADVGIAAQSGYLDPSHPALLAGCNDGQARS
jgi:2-oxoglutarate ferredoxin oxidoreductase subunit gamma